jgi:hypothetical protein
MNTPKPIISTNRAAMLLIKEPCHLQRTHTMATPKVGVNKDRRDTNLPLLPTTRTTLIGSHTVDIAQKMHNIILQLPGMSLRPRTIVIREYTSALGKIPCHNCPRSPRTGSLLLIDQLIKDEHGTETNLQIGTVLENFILTISQAPVMPVAHGRRVIRLPPCLSKVIALPEVIRSPIRTKTAIVSGNGNHRIIRANERPIKGSLGTIPIMKSIKSRLDLSA